MRIAIFTSGRFHVCDLARELDALGNEVKFYSLVPPWRTKQFGLPRRCNRWLMPRIGHRFIAARASRATRYAERSQQILREALDRAAARAIEPCDVFIGMSGMCNEVTQEVRSRYAAHVWIERGSRHILSQREILSKLPKARQVSDFDVERELIDYEQADVVSVLARHCEQSFVERGFPRDRIVRNPLGVDLNTFAPTPAPGMSPPRIIIVGTWSYRKGCDVLVEAWRRLPGMELWHVGAVDDLEIPREVGFTHFDSVSQRKLKGFYSQAHVLALASREEGLATVQAQAIACGLRLVCTTRTGGEDLAERLGDRSIVRVVEPDDVDQLAGALSRAVDDCHQDHGIRNRLDANERLELSWQGYGRRYLHALKARRRELPGYDPANEIICR
jgi:glycosyltransferase involved in cell wall biosynthesis